MIEDIVLEFTDEPELVMETDQPFDLIGDTVSRETVLEGVLFHMPNGVPEYGICTYDADTSDGTAQPGDIASGKIAYSKGSKIVGTQEIQIKRITNVQRTSSNHILRAGSYANGTTLFTIALSELRGSGVKDIYLQTGQMSLSQVTGTSDINKNQISWLPIMDTYDNQKISAIRIKAISNITLQRLVYAAIIFNITTAYIAT